VYVLDDGGEVDLDMGNYERFVGTKLSWDNNITTGKVYNSVIEKERKGEYLGKTVQIIPHITDEIQSWIRRVAHVPVDGEPGNPDVCIIELGGTVGDIESMPFVEALRQLQYRVGRENLCFVHVSLVPELGSVGEQKSKPTQMSVKELRALGIHPDLVVCRSAHPMDPAVRNKIAMFSQVPKKKVLGVHDVSNVYRVPLLLEDQGIAEHLQEILHLTSAHPDLSAWREAADRQDALQQDKEGQVVTIAAVGKYTDLSDAYLSVTNALNHAALNLGVKLKVNWIEADHLEPPAGTDSERSPVLAASGSVEPSAVTTQEDHDRAWEKLRTADGVHVPGGFGGRGIEGKIAAAKYAREAKVPFLGVCLGMQLAVVEICRNVCGWPEANSAEFQDDANPVAVVYMPEISQTHMGGTMRLGKRRTRFRDRSCTTATLYGGVETVDERHRHRYEVNPELAASIEEKSKLRFVGCDESGQRMEVVELPRDGDDAHPYFVGVQYHPEFVTRPLRPSPPFVGLLAAAAGKLDALLAKPDALPLHGEHDAEA
jgi:CTP synthase